MPHFEPFALSIDSWCGVMSREARGFGPLADSATRGSPVLDERETRGLTVSRWFTVHRQDRYEGTAYVTRMGDGPCDEECCAGTLSDVAARLAACPVGCPL